MLLADGQIREYRNPLDGSTYYGVDDDNGRTDWYNEDGDLDSYSDTPSDDEQEMNDAGYF